MQDLRIAAFEPNGLVDLVVEMALAALAGDEPIAPSVLRLLLRGYAMTGREDVEAAIGPALARALDPPAPRTDRCSDWLVLFIEAAALSEDERLRGAALSLDAEIRLAWPSA